jgi:hypothetical protein
VQTVAVDEFKSGRQQSGFRVSVKRPVTIIPCAAANREA